MSDKPERTAEEIIKEMDMWKREIISAAQRASDWWIMHGAIKPVVMDILANAQARHLDCKIELERVERTK
jgi:short-subunit dehydrogenase